MGQRRRPPVQSAGRVGGSPLAQAAGLLLLRLGPAVVFLVHGYLKVLGGHHDRTAHPFALLLAVEMAVAIWKVRVAQGFVGASEYELVILLACLAVALLGPGALSLAGELPRR